MSSRRTAGASSTASSRRESSVPNVSQPSSTRSSPSLAREDHEQDRDTSVDVSFIGKRPLLDICFLHAISTHRPLGPHKHFNVLPVLLEMDRAMRQLEAGYRDGVDQGDDEDVSGNESDRSDSPRHARRPSKQRTIKREDGEFLEPNDTLLTMDMIWQRFEELFDVRGLEELEEQAIDGDEHSPFHSTPARANLLREAQRIFAESSLKASNVFGFGESVWKIPKSNKPSKNTGNIRGKRKVDGKPVHEENVEEDEVEEDVDFVDFQLGPWEDFESLIAPRRSHSAGSGSDSDEELSDLSDENINSSGDTAKHPSQQIRGKAEDDGGGREHSSSLEEISDDDQQERSLNGDGDEEGRPNKRANASSSSKKGTKRANASSSGRSGSKGSSSAVPRRSTRR